MTATEMNMFNPSLSLNNDNAAWTLIFAAWMAAGVIPESIRPCTQGVPCSEKVIEWFGFVTIPLLSLAAFTTIIALLAFAYSRGFK